MRATALTMKATRDKNGKERKPHRSCGCESRRAYRDFLDNRAVGIGQIQRQIWLAHQEGKTFKQLAAQYPRPDVPVISAIVRLYDRDHDASRMSAIPRDSKVRLEAREVLPPWAED